MTGEFEYEMCKYAFETTFEGNFAVGAPGG
jgi:hypothetical protein